jgi:macrolide-specific efflux system membrane fusion protein
MSSTERAALIDAASAKGPEELKRWTELYQPTPILAPISGTLIQRNVESGQTFTTGDAIMVMSDRLTVKALVDETDIAQIKLKQKAKIVLDAYPSQTIPAQVDQIAYDAKTVNNVTTYVVDILPEQTPAFMRSGMTANVTFFVASKKDVLLVPAGAVRMQDGSPVVTLKGQKASTPGADTKIETGASDGKRIEVLSGLAEGDVVLEPQYVPGSKQAGGTNPFSPMGRGRKH